MNTQASKTEPSFEQSARNALALLDNLKPVSSKDIDDLWQLYQSMCDSRLVAEKGLASLRL